MQQTKLDFEPETFMHCFFLSWLFFDKNICQQSSDLQLEKEEIVKIIYPVITPN